MMMMMMVVVLSIIAEGQDRKDEADFGFCFFSSWIAISNIGKDKSIAASVAKRRHIERK
jgi:hypothetical protein